MKYNKYNIFECEDFNLDGFKFKVLHFHKYESGNQYIQTAVRRFDDDDFDFVIDIHLTDNDLHISNIYMLSSGDYCIRFYNEAKKLIDYLNSGGEC